MATVVSSLIDVVGNDSAPSRRLMRLMVVVSFVFIVLVMIIPINGFLRSSRAAKRREQAGHCEYLG